MTMKKILLLAIIALCAGFAGCSKDDEDKGLITDGCGNTYTEIIIGTQTWLKEDLNTSKYINGEDIERADGGSARPAYEDRGAYGYFYNFAAVETNKLCPKGYAVPTKADFETLITYFGGENIDKDSIIERYVNTWFGKSNGTGGGFNEGSGIYGTSTTTYDYSRDWHMYYRTEEPVGLGMSSSDKVYGHNIRCIKKQ